MEPQIPAAPHGLGESFQYFGLALLFLRLIRGLSQAELAELAGIRSNQISRYETSQVLPQLMQVERLTTALGMDPLGFFSFVAQVRSLVLMVGAADKATARVAADVHSALFKMDLLHASFSDHLREIFANSLEAGKRDEPTRLSPVAALTPEVLEEMAARMRQQQADPGQAAR